MSEYVVLQGFTSTSKQMTLNCHFALNTVLRVDSFTGSMDALVLGRDCFKIDGDAYIQSGAKMHPTVCDFLLVINSNLGPILHCFGDTVVYWSKNRQFVPTPVS